MDWWKSLLAALAEAARNGWSALAANRGRGVVIKQLDNYEKDVLRLFAARNVQRLPLDGVVAGLLRKKILEQVGWDPSGDAQELMLATWARQRLGREPFFREVRGG